MPRNCAPKSSRQLSSLGTVKIWVTCVGCGNPFQLETRHQAGAAGRKQIFCSEQCAHNHDLMNLRREGTGDFLSGLGPEGI